MPDKKKAAPKKAAAPKKVTQEFDPLGYRGHDEAEKHFPCSTFLMKNEQEVRVWAAERSNEPAHQECGFLIEEVRFDPTTYHLVNRTGNLPDDPLQGPIEWQRAAAPLGDLGPIWDHLSIQDLKDKGMPPEVIAAAELALKARAAAAAVKPEAKAKTKANGKAKPLSKKEEAKAQKRAEAEGLADAQEGADREAAKKANGKAKPAEPKANGKALPAISIGSSHPVPKPGQNAGHRPSGHRSLKLSSAKPKKSLKANGKTKSKKRV